ncbi:MAG: secondary thiamine-phosphate synthase enzyme YjbQ [Candidatus Poseidoniia archaeon]|jgi:secondary thiamine-phosphate synthase enzyme|nr:secondary thiamine-phosphate synthase enzyme YjbQ [Candidatus Poseidoniia archaeon]MDP6847070.1 secondary thiamine-phosphate synthase enzyme YjbQ [Candidatus Poseidoniia archaeon]MDP7007243.1 secondary thiamine-phosphate synthase enzyme YjbQ [Candidatus Poseidoniia archaeon]
MRRRTLAVQTEPYAFHDITREVQGAVADAGVSDGVCHLFIRHTSASLLLQENYDPSVRQDLAQFMSRIVPEDGSYVHGMEGSDDMPAHIRSALTSVSESIPVSESKLLLGRWQGIYLWEHRAHGHRREVIITVTGD